jgi:hypothetical protein
VRALKGFAANHPECQPGLLYRGDRPRRIDDIPCLPLDRFLHDLRPARPLPLG